MKIIGLMLTWNNFDFFNLAFKQALSFCDEVLIIEGCHSKQYERYSTDGTREYIKNLPNHPRVQKIMDFGARAGRYDKTQKTLRQQFPKLSKFYELGNWVIHWDDDRFFFEEDLEKLKAVMNRPPVDCFRTKMRYFLYNFRFNWLQWNGICAYRIIDEMNIRGVSNPVYKNGEDFRVEDVPEVTAFHYCYVKRPERMKARWDMSIEKATKESKGRFEVWSKLKWKDDQDILEKKKELIKIRGHFKGFNIYNGEHPKAIQSHPWKDIEDIRTIS